MLVPPVILTVQLPGTIRRGRQVTGTVSIGRRAQPGGENVWLTTNVPGASRRRLTVPGGEASTSFSVAVPTRSPLPRQLQVTLSVGDVSVTRAIDLG
jgi:hypothetical protein